MIVWYSAPPASAPEPRLTARSMLSLGTDDFLAFWMASNSVGLPAGSPPPTRAATSTFLISLANILPRRASMTAFLCFVVAHLEWPLIRYYLFPHCEVRSTSLRGRRRPTEPPRAVSAPRRGIRLRPASRDDLGREDGSRWGRPTGRR